MSQKLLTSWQHHLPAESSPFSSFCWFILIKCLLSVWMSYVDDVTVLWNPSLWWRQAELQEWSSSEGGRKQSVCFTSTILYFLLPCEEANTPSSVIVTPEHSPNCSFVVDLKMITKTICQLQNFSLNRNRMEVLQVLVLETDETITIETAEQGSNAPVHLCSV